MPAGPLAPRSTAKASAPAGAARALRRHFVSRLMSRGSSGGRRTSRPIFDLGTHQTVRAVAVVEQVRAWRVPSRAVDVKGPFAPADRASAAPECSRSSPEVLRDAQAVPTCRGARAPGRDRAPRRPRPGRAGAIGGSPGVPSGPRARTSPSSTRLRPGVEDHLGGHAWSSTRPSSTS